MSVRTKILLFMGSLVAVYVALLFAFTTFSSRQVEVVLADRADQRTKDLSVLLELFSAQQKTIVDDYSLWTDMVELIDGTRGPSWARINIDQTRDNFKFDAVWVYGLDEKLRWETDSFGGDPELRKLTLPHEGFARVVSQKSLHYYVDTPRGVMEIYARTVHHTDDDFRIVPYGFFMIGQIVTEDRLGEIGATLGGTLMLGSSTSTVPYGSTDMLIRNELTGWDGHHVATVVGVIPLSLAEQLRASSRQFVIISISFGLVTLGIVFLLLFYLVSRPLRLIANGLEQRNDTWFTSFAKDPSEFGVLARSATQFFAEEKALEREKAKIDALLGSISDGVIGIDTEWNITTINTAAARLLGVDADKILGKQFRSYVKLIRSRDRGEHLIFIEEAFVYRKTSTTDEDVVLVYTDGSEIPITSSSAPILDDNGKVTGVVVILHDATREIQTRMIRSDFAYASHQLRTPVTETMWAITSALGEKTLGTKNEDLRVAEQSIKSVHKLVEHLLVVSEIDQKTVMPHRMSVRVDAIVREAVAALQDSMKSRKISPRISIDSSLPELVTDPKLLRGILNEIIENAVGYGELGSTVFVTAEKETNGVHVVVRNTGKPLLDKELPLVFTKFFRGANATLVPGAGLGLYIAREYAKLLNGKIWFTSEYSEGTSFHILLPNA